MNFIWPEEAVKRWSNNMALMRDIKQRTIKWRRINGWMAVGEIAMGFVHTCSASYWWTLLSTLLCWWMYRFYRKALRREAQWHNCLHHASRVLHETVERSQWHLEQMQAMLIEMGAVEFSPEERHET